MPNIQIIASNESVIGLLRFTICNNREELEKCHNFERSRPSLDQCLRHVAMEEEYPMAFLNQITVDKDYRRNADSYGSSLMHTFEEISTKHGCKMAACKIGWILGESTRDGNISFYKSCNWELHNTSTKEPIMAFKALDANHPQKPLKRKTMLKMVVFYNDENFPKPLAPN